MKLGAEGKRLIRKCSVTNNPNRCGSEFVKGSLAVRASLIHTPSGQYVHSQYVHQHQQKRQQRAGLKN